MNKILVGLIVGAVLGLIDGATAWFTPEVRNQMLGIIIGSTFKGVLAGIAAGWFARKVQSVPKGIAFGFAVGLVLAFAVAAMPGENGEHYWWQIMVPGSILGGVIGWATQRYGKPGPSPRTATAAAMLVLALVTVQAQAHDGHEAKPTPNAFFEKLKTLEGTWDATMLTPDGEKTTVQYRVSAGGTVVQETMFAGTPMEMINMYTIEADTIVATHYCSGDNQPTLRLNTGKSSASELVFDFVNVRGRNTKDYINGMTVKFGADGKFQEVWSSLSEGPHMTLYVNGRR